MSSTERLKIRRTLVFRLTLWYAIAFTVSSLVAFSLFYIIISNAISEQTDQALLKQVAEHGAVLRLRGGSLSMLK